MTMVYGIDRSGISKTMKANPRQIVVVKVEETTIGNTYAGRPIGPQRIEREARAAMWLRAGGDADESAARTWAARNDYEVMIFPPTERDPIGKAKAAALAAAVAAAAAEDSSRQQ